MTERSYRPWALWRRIQYGSGFAAFWVLIGISVYFLYFYTAASCFDLVMNANETGIDCGGGCVRICAADVLPPKVVWAESFKVVDGQYNAVAYLENRNEIAATPELKYTFTLLDNGVVIAERRGTTILPPGSTYPVFEGRISTRENKVPTETKLILEPAELWVPATEGRDQFRTTDIKLSSADYKPRLVAQVENTTLVGAQRVEVVATIFNQVGKAVAASQTYVDQIARQSKQEVVFTWPQPIAKSVRSCEVPSDVMIVLDRSGSMAADGGTPPEPLESAKKAAVLFTSLLQPADTFGFLSYATKPSSPIDQLLTNNSQVMKTAISNLTMGSDGTQYTNMGDAFKVVTSELTGVRHRQDARKVIVFLTDGDVTRPVNPTMGKADREYAARYALAAAEAAKAQNVIIYTIGFGDFLKAPSSEVARDTALIKNLASDPANYYEAPTIADLERVYKQIATSICEVGPARVEVLPKTAAGFTPLGN